MEGFLMRKEVRSVPYPERVFLWLVFAGVCLGADPAHGWNALGHRLMAQAAAVRLTPQAKSEVEALLGEPAEVALPAVANWADNLTATRPETRPWHYVNIPLRADGYDDWRDCFDGACVVRVLDRQIALWRDRTRTVDERREALMFIVHLVGDLHQPLHCADASDRGGNDTLVEYAGQRSNLHRVLDGEFFPWDESDLSSGNVEEDAQAELDVRRWADESHRIGVEEIYAKLPRARADRVVALEEGDIGRFWSLVQQRLRLAAARLARLLNVDP